MLQIKDIRELFAEKYKSQNFVTDKSGVKTIEIIGETFEVTEDSIFGEPNKDYIKREIDWYVSQSLNVNDIPGETPKIWKQVATKSGEINSNYGYLIYSKENYNQYENCLHELLRNRDSRRACMIYTRPSIHLDYNRDGMSDFICTESVKYYIRDNQLIALVSMRSNDGWAGFRNDKYWQQYVLDELYSDLQIQYNLSGKKIFWISGSLHLYEQQFYLIDHYIKTGETSITKENYNKLYNK
jgi:thymidylate synthase